MSRKRCAVSRRHCAPGVVGAVGLLVMAGPAWGGIILNPGTYPIRDHPGGGAKPPSYGLRLDELIDLTDEDDIWTFSFDHPQSNMSLTLTDLGGGNYSIDIFGTAYGGLDIDSEWDPVMQGVAEIQFSYALVTQVPGDDDLWVLGPTAGNMGSIDFMGNQFDLFDKANDDGVTFRLGNEDDDMGHRDFPGTSVWGWLNHTDPDVHYPASDWLFIVVPSPGTTTLLLTAGLIGFLPRRRR